MERKNNKNNEKIFPETPGADPFFNLPSDCADMVNTFGTYNIQRTCDTGNLFPAIAHGMPDSKHIIEKLNGETDRP